MPRDVLWWMRSWTSLTRSCNSLKLHSITFTPWLKAGPISLWPSFFPRRHPFSPHTHVEATSSRQYQVLYRHFYYLMQSISLCVSLRTACIESSVADEQIQVLLQYQQGTVRSTTRMPHLSTNACKYAQELREHQQSTLLYILKWKEIFQPLIGLTLYTTGLTRRNNLFYQGI